MFLDKGSLDIARVLRDVLETEPDEESEYEGETRLVVPTLADLAAGKVWRVGQ